tara:strand:- start:625 stop:954 length:330 start_codon:yes stop_codon:yes gene_type:complete
MKWPPAKAWTSNFFIEGQRYFVAINYGGKSTDRWVVLMSVLDGNVVVKISWSQLSDKLKWNLGWNDNKSSKLFVNQSEIEFSNLTYPSKDSGLTIPIHKRTIRPWFINS